MKIKIVFVVKYKNHKIHKDEGIIEINQTIKKEIDVKKQTIGVIIYIIVFIIGIPLLLYKNKYFSRWRSGKIKIVWIYYKRRE